MAIISGTALAAQIKQKQSIQIAHYQQQYGRVPAFVILLVGDDLASQSYVNGKMRAAKEVGLQATLRHFPDRITETELLEEVERHNRDPRVDGIIVQLPLPDHINPERVLERIAINKDVDGFHPHNVARLWLSEPCILPCTPKGIMRILQEIKVPLAGSSVVVIGRGNIVGKPISKLLLDADATVTITHSKSKNLAEITRGADIIVSAVGRRNIITADMIKTGAVVIDVGINRDPEDGRLYGDTDFESVSQKASYITPVPGGVGPMTICMLIENTIESFCKQVENR